MQGVPIIVAHLVLLKHNSFLLRDFISSINLHQLKVGFFLLFQCEIKLIHQMVNFLKPFLLIFTRGARVGGHGIYRFIYYDYWDYYYYIIIIILLLLLLLLL